MHHWAIRVAILVFFFLPASLCQAEPQYSFGIVPQQSASKLASHWVPILSYISKTSGVKLVFKTTRDIPAFEQQLSGGHYDFAYMNPYHYTVFHDQTDYEAILKARDKHIRGIIVVRKDSPYKTLEDLDGASLAFPSPYAFAASMLTRAELNRRNIHYYPFYVSSHDSVYRNVEQQRFPAGGGVIRTLNTMDPEVSDKLRILWTSREFTPHAIAVHNKVPEEHRIAIQKAFIEMENNTEGKALLSQLSIKGLASAIDSDWNDIRKLRLDKNNNIDK